MNLPEPLRIVLKALTKRGRPYLVGGCVRDWLLGLEPKDFDIEVFGLGWEDLEAALAPFGPTDPVGRSFGVVKVRVGGCDYDVSLPRREAKTGLGHRGFAVEPAPGLAEAAASARRDFTINALLYDPITARVIDHHGGVADLHARLLRHTSAAFVEDPLRVLRGFQLAARFDLALAPETAAVCAGIRSTYGELPIERVWLEWEKWAARSVRPSRGLLVLKQTRWLEHVPEAAALDGVPQDPEWHPEGDVFTHTGCCLDALVRLPAWAEASTETRRSAAFAVLCHDMGKPEATRQTLRHGTLRWTSFGHDRAGGPRAEAFLERIGSPLALRPVVRALVEHHHAHQPWPPAGPSDTAVRRLARKLAPATIDLLCLVMEADHLGRPPLVSAETRARIDGLRSASARLALQQSPPAPLVRGRDLAALGLSPGPGFGAILRAAYEAQIEGAFTDVPSAQGWLRDHLERRPAAAGRGAPPAGG
jgi:tRNA nucleotidyltransferase (CCA-adding enzyme)